MSKTVEEIKLALLMIKQEIADLEEQLKQKEDHKKYCHPNCPAQED